MGFIFQGHCLLDEFSCVENVLMPLTIRQGKPTGEQRERAILLLNRVGLGDQLHKLPDEMSGGQNQRCVLARALVHEPKIVLADEPTGDLDRRSGNQFLETMREMNRESGVAFVMVTHDDRLAQAADRILLIEDGLIQEISKDEHRRKSAGVGPLLPQILLGHGSMTVAGLRLVSRQLAAAKLSKPPDSLD